MLNNNELKTFVFDIDGTICTNTNGDYKKAKPYFDRIEYINNLFEKGHKIIMFTARGYTTNINWQELTKKQLSDWGLKYHELKLKKPFGDIYIDDKGITDKDFFKLDIKNKNSKIIKNSQKFIRILEEFIDDEETHKSLEVIAKKIYQSLLNGGKLMICGNGGSMSDALHISAEFTGRFKEERRPLASIVLGSNQSSLSCIANDFSFKEVFSRELVAVGKANDVLLLLSTSGQSPNILECLNTAKKMNISTFLFTSNKFTENKNMPEIVVKVRHRETDMIQQMHIYFGHILCEYIDEYIKYEE